MKRRRILFENHSSQVNRNHVSLLTCGKSIRVSFPDLPAGGSWLGSASTDRHRGSETALRPTGVLVHAHTRALACFQSSVPQIRHGRAKLCPGRRRRERLGDQEAQAEPPGCQLQQLQSEASGGVRPSLVIIIDDTSLTYHAFHHGRLQKDQVLSPDPMRHVLPGSALSTRISTRADTLC